MRRSVVCYLLFAVLAPLATSQAQSIHILQRARLGNNTEDITFIGNGPLAGTIGVLDGSGVLGISPNHGKHELFNLRRLGVSFGANGLTYVKSSNLFALADGIQPTTLFLADDHGQSKGTRKIRYLDNFLPDWLEGLSYVPKKAQNFPDHILLSAIVFVPQQSRIEVLRKDGLVEAEIIPAEPLGSSYITGVGYLAPDRILVADISDIWEIDFAGNILAGPVAIDGTGDIEGVAQLSNGDIVAADYEAGKVFFFDKNLNRLQGKDRNYKVGVGVSIPSGVAWNSDTNQHLVAHPGFTPQATEIVSIPRGLNSGTQVVDLAKYAFNGREKLTYLPDEHLIAAANRNNPKAIVLFDSSGSLVEQIDVSALGRPNAITYIPTTKQFAVEFLETPLQLSILDRHGRFVRAVDLSSNGLSGVGAVTFFDPADHSGGKFLMIVNDATHIFQQFVMITDLNGTVRRKFDIRKTLGLLAASDVSAITSGPQQGAFSIVDGTNSEIVIFRLH